MSFEVEQKYRFPGHDAVASRLQELGAVPGPTVEQEDAYLNHPARDFASTNEALRLRGVGESNAITYKGPRHAGPTKTREEIEIPFAGGSVNLAQMQRLLILLGFRPVAVIRKRRTPYHFTYDGRPVEVALDLAEGIGTFVEVEVLAADRDELPAAQHVVMSLAARLGLTDLEPRSYLRMALEQRARAVGD